jgi:hypothetical protein
VEEEVVAPVGSHSMMTNETLTALSFLGPEL